MELEDFPEGRNDSEFADIGTYPEGAITKEEASSLLTIADHGQGIIY